MALRVDIWIDADRYAHAAFSAARKLLDEGDAAVEETWLECLYLLGLTKRFVIASTPPSAIRGREDISAENLVQAVTSLEQAEQRHRELGQGEHAFRALAEQMAVRLFYANWKAVTPAAKLMIARFDGRVALKQYAAALAALRQGWIALDALRANGRFLDPHPLNSNAAVLAVIGEAVVPPGRQRSLLSAGRARPGRVRPAADDQVPGRVPPNHLYRRLRLPVAGAWKRWGSRTA